MYACRTNVCMHVCLPVGYHRYGNSPLDSGDGIPITRPLVLRFGSYPPMHLCVCVYIYIYIYIYIYT